MPSILAKIQRIDKFKIIVSKVFGIGKSSKDKTDILSIIGFYMR